MAENETPYQPGAILYDAILGSFRAHGASLEGWLIENGVKPPLARAAMYGQSQGPVGRALLARIIAAAGPDVVRAGYLSRLHRHLEEVHRSQSRMAAEHGARHRERRAS